MYKIAFLGMLIVPLAGCERESQAWTRGKPCSDEELPQTIAGCEPHKNASRCVTTIDEEEQACQDGCVMRICKAATPAPIAKRARETSCGDTHGPTYWANLISAAVVCESRVNQGRFDQRKS